MNYIVVCVNSGEVDIAKFDYYDDAIDYFNDNKNLYLNIYVTDIIKSN